MFPINVQIQKTADFIFTEPDPPQPFQWLYMGRVYGVRPEKRGQGVYWYMRKMLKGTRHNLYVSPAGKLTPDLLNNAAEQVETFNGPEDGRRDPAHASPVKPNPLGE